MSDTEIGVVGTTVVESGSLFLYGVFCLFVWSGQEDACQISND